MDLNYAIAFLILTIPFLSKQKKISRSFIIFVKWEKRLEQALWREEIILTADLVEHRFNGNKVVSFEPWTDGWYARKAEGKWETAPDYGKFKTSYIGLQNHDSPLWFKNIKIKKL